nr:MAG TPA: hypothetical protein [Microviridae sp.]
MSWLSGLVGGALGIWSANKSAGAQAALSHEQMQYELVVRPSRWCARHLVS